MKYFWEETNELCTGNMSIDTLDECKLAISYLVDLGAEIVFNSTESNNHSPKGCYKDRESNNAYWNNHAVGSTNQYAEPICKGD